MNKLFKFILELCMWKFTNLVWHESFEYECSSNIISKWTHNEWIHAHFGINFMLQYCDLWRQFYYMCSKCLPSYILVPLVQLILYKCTFFDSVFIFFYFKAKFVLVERMRELVCNCFGNNITIYQKVFL